MTTSIQQGLLVPVDLALGVAAPVWRLGVGTTRVAARAAAPWLRLSLRPPGVPAHLQPGHWLTELALAGADRREELGGRAARRLDVVVPATAGVVLDRIDLTEVVVERVDLETVVTTVLDRLDLTAVVLERVDLQAVVTTVLDRLDLTAVVLQRVDLEAVVTTVLDRLDLTAVVLQRVDLEAVVTTVLDRLDLTAVVLQRVDLEAVVTTVLDRLDLTEIVLQRVDLQAVVTTVLDRLDLTEIVLQRVDLQAVVATVLSQTDLVAIAEEVIDAVDLPEIIRESTGSMASDTVRGARMQGISADEAVGRAVDRLLLRHTRRGAPVPDLPPVTVSEGAPRSHAPERTP
ncbi:pentapeptide repeat-containing protein [Nocardioides terrigena]|uniref:pentapeptide repeat-containing protein n=1 Tax=Nocardioides terrigena TaxID=424797 RepID=UPI000D321F77|nr:pentapeptide repeat-containing protein [Nocardioides terrigena]